MFIIAHRKNSKQLMSTSGGQIINFEVEDNAETFLTKQYNANSYYVRKAIPSDFSRSNFRKRLVMK